MMPLVDLAKMIVAEVRIDLGRPDVGMAKKHLNDAKIGAISKKVRRKRMAEPVGAHVFFNARFARVISNEFPKSLARHGAATAREKNGALGRASPKRSHFTEIALDRLARLETEGNDAAF